MSLPGQRFPTGEQRSSHRGNTEKTEVSRSNSLIVFALRVFLPGAPCRRGKHRAIDCYGTARACPRCMEAWVEEIPYGLQVSDDCTRLVGNPVEIEIIVRALDMIVEDCPLSQVADRLNQDGYRMRTGDSWTPSALFALLPRMIQVGPRVFSSGEWQARRVRLSR